MKTSFSAIVAVLSAVTAVSADTLLVTMTITAKEGCPTGPAPDVMVTRSDVPVPSCEAGSNSTKPTIVTMPGYGAVPTMNMPGGSGTSTSMPSEFTGAAGRTAVQGAMVVLGGVAVYLM